MALTTDGGKVCIAGFLYQFCGVGALTCNVNAAPPKSGARMDALFSLAANAEVKSEAFGQDATVEHHGSAIPGSKKRRTYLQYKFSSAPNDNALNGTELKQIADSLRRSEFEANRSERLPSQFALVTNRPLNTTAKKLLRKTLRCTRRKKRGTRTTQAQVLNQLRVFRASGDAWIAQLENFAKDRGMLDDELSAGVDRVCGALTIMAGSIGSSQITSSWLTGHLCGTRTLKMITPTALVSTMREDLELNRGACLIPTSITEREVFRDVVAAILASPVVVLQGSGGSGKTVVMHEALRHILANSPTLRFVICDAAGQLQENHLSRRVVAWRDSEPSLAAETSLRVLSRLQSALSTDSRPVLVQGIDGIDEDVRNPTYMMSLLDDLWRDFRQNSAKATPRWVIVATCRTTDELQSLWYNFRNPVVAGAVAVIAVGEFAYADLRRAVETLSAPVRDRLIKHLSAAGANDDLQLAGTLVDSTPVSKLQILTELRHPAMWGSFVQLSPEVQLQILDSRDAALRSLAELYITRFVTKGADRQPLLSVDDLNVLVRLVAHHTSTVSAPYRRVQDWIEPVLLSGEFDKPEAKAAWDEALSAGLIDRDSKEGWRWRHQFVADALEFLHACSLENQS